MKLKCWLLLLGCLFLSGCGDFEWFPDSSSSNASTSANNTSSTSSNSSSNTNTNSNNSSSTNSSDTSSNSSSSNNSTSKTPVWYNYSTAAPPQDSTPVLDSTKVISASLSIDKPFKYTSSNVYYDIFVKVTNSGSSPVNISVRVAGTDSNGEEISSTATILSSIYQSANPALNGPVGVSETRQLLQAINVTMDDIAIIKSWKILSVNIY